MMHPAANALYKIDQVYSVDNNLALDCYYIASEFMGDAGTMHDSIKHSVNNQRHPMFVATKPNGYVCGFIVGRPATGGHAAEITSLYVTANMHRHGIGGQLLGRMENWLRSNGAQVVNLTARPWAVPFYLAQGYARRRVGACYLQKSL